MVTLLISFLIIAFGIAIANAFYIPPRETDFEQTRFYVAQLSHTEGNVWNSSYSFGDCIDVHNYRQPSIVKLNGRKPYILLGYNETCSNRNEMENAEHRLSFTFTDNVVINERQTIGSFKLVHNPLHPLDVIFIDSTGGTGQSDMVKNISNNNCVRRSQHIKFPTEVQVLTTHSRRVRQSRQPIVIFEGTNCESNTAIPDPSANLYSPADLVGRTLRQTKIKSFTIVEDK